MWARALRGWKQENPGGICQLLAIPKCFQLEHSVLTHFSTLIIQIINSANIVLGREAIHHWRMEIPLVNLGLASEALVPPSPKYRTRVPGKSWCWESWALLWALSLQFWTNCCLPMFLCVKWDEQTHGFVPNPWDSFGKWLRGCCRCCLEHLPNKWAGAEWKQQQKITIIWDIAAGYCC